MTLVSCWLSPRSCLHFLTILNFLPHKLLQRGYLCQKSQPGIQCPSEIDRRRQWHPTPVLLPGKSHGWRSLVGCSPWGCGESDTTERLHFHFLLSCTGEGNGNPLQCSCLENPRDGGAWWAARRLWGRTESDTTEATQQQQQQNNLSFKNNFKF